MCDMLMSVTEDSWLRQLEKDCADVSHAMLSIPVMIPGTRYYKGIKVRQTDMHEQALESQKAEYPPLKL